MSRTLQHILSIVLLLTFSVASLIILLPIFEEVEGLAVVVFYLVSSILILLSRRVRDLLIPLVLLAVCSVSLLVFNAYYQVGLLSITELGLETVGLAGIYASALVIVDMVIIPVLNKYWGD